MSTNRIETEAQLEAALAAPCFVLLKHSRACAVSAGAFRHLEELSASRPATPCGWIEVREHRALSQAVAARTGVPHASPQAILLVAGRAAWDASHGMVTARAIERALDEAEAEAC